jgi:hypothetical protein
VKLWDVQRPLVIFFHCRPPLAARIFMMTRRYEVKAGEPLSVTARIMWAIPSGRSLVHPSHAGRHVAVGVTMALAVFPCSIVTAAIFACPSPKCHPIPKCLALASYNMARRRYIPFPKLLILKVNEFWRRTGEIPA